MTVASARRTSCSVSVFDNLVEVDQLTVADKLVYGTSDHSINPGEIWMTAEVSRVHNCPWEFFNYPLDSQWQKFDVGRVFEPYTFSYPDPFDSVQQMGLQQDVVDRMSGRTMQDLVQPGDVIMDLSVGDVVEKIREKRELKSFCIVNEMVDGDRKPVFCSSRNKRYRNHYKSMEFGELLRQSTTKMGGTMIYFLIGHAFALDPSVVMLSPNNVRGDVWGAVSAGAELAENPVRLARIGGFDLMTARQWELYQTDSRWRKAPPSAVARLQRHEFRHTLHKALVTNRHYCAVSVDEDTGRFSFELGSPGFNES